MVDDECGWTGVAGHETVGLLGTSVRTQEQLLADSRQPALTRLPLCPCPPHGKQLASGVTALCAITRPLLTPSLLQEPTEWEPKKRFSDNGGRAYKPTMFQKKRVRVCLEGGGCMCCFGVALLTYRRTLLRPRPRLQLSHPRQLHLAT